MKEVLELVEPTTNTIQKSNKNHSYKVGRHWKLFLQDLENSKPDHSSNLIETLNFLWGVKNLKAHQLDYTFDSIFFRLDAVFKLLVIEIINATKVVALSTFAESTYLVVNTGN